MKRKIFAAVAAGAAIMILALAIGSCSLVAGGAGEDLEGAEKAASGLTVHFKKPASWASVRVYWWNASPASASPAWPGNAMTNEGNGWYAYTLSGASSANIVFNNGSGGGANQTVDLSRSGEGWCWTTSQDAALKWRGAWNATNPDAFPFLGPWLSWDGVAGPENGIVVNFQTAASCYALVEYGTSASLGSRANGSVSGTLHHIRLTALAPSTTYYYRVGDSGGQRSATWSFRTAALGDSSFSYAVLGDMQDNNGDRRWNDVAVELSGKHKDLDFIICIGDMVWDDAPVWWEAFFRKGRDILATTAFMPVPGNHDTPTSSSNADTSSFRKYFSLPASGSAAHYSFRYGNSFFLGLNSEIPSEFALNTGAQYGFAKARLDAEFASASKPAWAFAYWHIGPYDIALRHYTQQGTFRDMTGLFGGRVDWAFSGHEHLTQRFKPLAYNATLVSRYGTAAGQGVGYLAVPPAGNWPETAIIPWNSSQAHYRARVAFPSFGSTANNVASEVGFVKVGIEGRSITMNTYWMGDLSSSKPGRIVDSVSYSK